MASVTELWVMSSRAWATVCRALPHPTHWVPGVQSTSPSCSLRYPGFFNPCIRGGEPHSFPVQASFSPGPSSAFLRSCKLLTLSATFCRSVRFSENVDLGFHQIPGGIHDLKKVRSPYGSERKRSEIDPSRTSRTCHPRFACHGYTRTPLPLEFCPCPGPAGSGVEKTREGSLHQVAPSPLHQASGLHDIHLLLGQNITFIFT